jgi:hypothetical protein
MTEAGRANRQVIVLGRQERDREVSLGIGSEIALFACDLTVDDQWRASYKRSTGVARAASDRTGVGLLAKHRESANAQTASELRLGGAEIFRMASSYVCAATVAGKVN